MKNSLVVIVGGGRGIDGRQLEIKGTCRQYFNWPYDRLCTCCGHSHISHFEESESYKQTPELQKLLRRDLQIMFDRRRVLRTGCDECTCEGLL